MQVIYAKSGEIAKECEALILLAEVICSISLNINSLLLLWLGEHGEFQLQPSCGRFDGVPSQEDQVPAQRFQVLTFDRLIKEVVKLRMAVF